ncbi:MAG: glycosyltransferase family 39 protein [Bryobacteraceae bacterium]|nr:glycosyltransferase family 39 protein [Bryobacteraceae bacterium]
MAFVERWFWIALLALLAAGAAIQISTMLGETQTFDEGFHLAAGYSYWSQGDYRMNPEHPPLGKMLCALPLLWLKPAIPVRTKAWHDRDQWAFSDAFLYENRVPVDTMLNAARMVSVAITAALGLAVAWWTRRRFGAAAGLLAQGFTTFDPNLLAHGRYVTTDVIVSLFFFLTVACWIEYLDHGGHWAIAAGLSLGAALASKYSALILLPVLLGLTLLRRRDGWWRGFAMTLGLAAIVVAGTYGRETWRIVTGSGEIPSYWAGLKIVTEHNAIGHITYLLGERSQYGWWQYFPVAFAVKSPAAVLLGLASLAWAAIRWRREIPFAAWAVLLAAAFYFAVAMTGRLNLGLRHILPVYPLLYVFGSEVATRVRRGTVVAAALLALTAAESLARYPHYLAFFNVFAGGPSRGPEYLVDSNLDWGQDVKKLKAYLDAQGNPPLCIDYFGTAKLRYYGVQEGYLPRTDPTEIAKMDCLAAISVTLQKGLYIDPTWYRYLDSHQTVAKVGWSIYVYDFRKRKP